MKAGDSFNRGSGGVFVFCFSILFAVLLFYSVCFFVFGKYNAATVYLDDCPQPYCIRPPSNLCSTTPEVCRLIKTV